jgi:DNA repair protein RadC
LLIRIEITRRLREVGEITGVRVLDRIIIGKGCYVSFAD